MDIDKIKVNQNKQKILTWLEDIKANYTLADLEKLGRSDLLFSISLGDPSVVIYTITTHPDRIILQSDIMFSDNHKEVIVKMSEQNHAKFVVGLETLLATLNIRYRFFLKDNRVEKIRIHLFVHDDIMTKDVILQDFSRVQEVTIVLLNQINTALGFAVTTQTAQQVDDTKDRPGVT